MGRESHAFDVERRRAHGSGAATGSADAAAVQHGGRHPVRAARRLALVALTMVMVGTLLSSNTAGASTPRGVFFYGDSLIHEAEPTVRTRIPDATFRAYGGMAPCVDRRQLEADLPLMHPHLVVLETWGNTLGDCMSPTERVGGSQAYYGKIMDDFAAMFSEARAAGAKVLFVVGPPVKDDPMNRVQWSLVLLAASMGVPYTFAPHDAVGAVTSTMALGGAKWRATMRCLTGEPCDASGQVAVRAPDQVHFCPVGYRDQADYQDGCDVYSSGAYRWGRAIATAVKAEG